jgi:putative transposase
VDGWDVPDLFPLKKVANQLDTLGGRAMPRFKRLVVPGMPHHLVQRGNRRMETFRGDNDRDVFLRMLSEASKSHGVANVAYSLMPNHIHLVSFPERKESLALVMHDLLGLYAAYFNQKYGLCGRLWQGRFYSVVMDDPHFWAALRYVELNPVRSRLVDKAEDYRWSSARAHCGQWDDPLLAPLPQGVWVLGPWSAWLAEGECQAQTDAIRKCTKTGRPCGTESFLRTLELNTGRVLLPRKRGRPKKIGDVPPVHLISDYT